MRTFAAFLLGVAASFPVAAAEFPAQVLDLSRWKLTLPVNRGQSGRADEILQPELAAWRDPKHFFVNDAGDGVVFRAPCGGSTSKGSQYPRCELREMGERGRTLAAWSTRSGVHTLTATLAVTRTPPVKPHVVCAQIHDADDDLLMVRLEGKKLLVERNTVGDVVLATDYVLGTRFDLKIEASGGRVKLWYDGAPRLDWEVSRNGCYFKAGCYTQSNPKKGDDKESFGEVVIDRLQAVHQEQ